MAGDIGQWLQLAARAHRARLAEAIEDLGLFPGQETVLVALAEAEALSVGDLAEALKVRPPTISKTLQRLTVQGLVERRDGEGDARRTTVTLTKEGKRRAKALGSRLEAVETATLEALDEKDGKRLRKLLKRVARHLAKDRADTGATDTADEQD